MFFLNKLLSRSCCATTAVRWQLLLKILEEINIFFILILVYMLNKVMLCNSYQNFSKISIYFFK